MAENNDIVIDVKINTDEVSTKLAAAITATNDYKAAQAALNKTIKEQGYATKEQAADLTKVSASLAQSQRETKAYTALLQSETLARLDDNASLDEQRLALNAAQKAYAGLTGEAKKAADAEGGLRDQINKLSDSVKAQEAAMGDNRRNVGNYTQAVQQAFPAVGKLGKLFTTLKPILAAGKAGFIALAASIKTAMLSALKFLATPIGLALAAIGLTIKALVSSFQKLKEQIAKNDEASTNFARIYATTVQPILDGITKVFTKLADWAGKAAGKIADFFAKFSDASKAADDRVKAIDKLQDAERDYTLNSAKRSKEVARLRNEATDAEKYSVEERRAMLAQAIELEKQDLEDKKALAKERLRLLEDEARRAGDTSDAMKNRIVEARAEMTRAEEEYYTGTRRMQSQLNSFDADITKEREEREKKAAEERKARQEALAEQREQMRRREQTDLENDIEDLQKAMEKELQVVGLTEQEKQNIRDYYAEQMQARRQQDIDAEKAEAEEQAKIAAEAEAAKIQARMDARAQFGLDPEKTPEEQELELLQAAREQDLLNDEEYEYAKTLIQQKYSKMREDDIAAEVKAATEMYQNEMRTAASSAAGAIGALGDLMGAFAENSKEASEAQKAFAIGTILINQAMSIAEGAKGIAAAMAGAAEAAAATGPAAPIMLGVFQAQMVGQVLAIVASVASSIVQAKQVFDQGSNATQQFATGGIVGGTSYTGDRVWTRQNSREMDLTLEQQQNLFDALSNNTGSLGIDYGMMAEAMASVPAPVMAYSEFKEFEEDTTTYEELARV